MNRFFKSALPIIVLALLGAAPLQTGASASVGLQVKNCTVGASRVRAKCGTFTVYENRIAKTGRTIALYFILVEAKHPSGHAIAFNPGGPGASATDDVAIFADDSAPFALREQSDILLLDNRGTGRSAPQQCDFAPPAHPELYFMQLWPDTLVRECRRRLTAHADLSLYSTSVAADDLDDLRAALGYKKLGLFGGSYGTRLYLDYARRHPTRVESIVLDGVAPPHYYIIPLPMARGAQTAIDNLAAACTADATCAKHFPAFKAHFADLAHRFDAGPIRVPLRNSVTHRVQMVQLAKEVFAEAIRHALYFPNEAGYIPVVVERAHQGNYAPLASLVDEMSQEFANIDATGLNLSVSCAEDIPFINESDVASMSARTFEGDARVRAQQRACGIWNVRSVPRAFIDPVKSDLPILMVSGSDDPATPPQYAREAMRFLPNARMMLVKGASHDSDYPPCVNQAMSAFFRARSAAGLDLAHCAATYRRPAFATLTYFESAPGEQTALSARFRSLFTELLAGRIDRAQLTPAVSREYSSTVLKQFSSDISAEGSMDSFVYRGSHTSAKGVIYRYLAHFSQGNLSMTIMLNAAGKISNLDVSPG